MHLPQLVAHRGYTRHYPENTVPALDAAIAAGARYVEVDVQLSADRIPMLFHDDTLDRVCGVPGAIADYDAATLRTLPAREFDRFGYRYAQTPVATLSDLCDLLKRHPGVTAFVEIKTNTLARFDVPTVLSQILPLLQPLAPRCVLISFDDVVLGAARGQGWQRVGGVIERWRERKRPSLRALAPEFLFCDVAGLPRWGRLRAGGAQLVVYEVDDARLALRLAARGVPYIETFAVGELAAQLATLAPS
jgi:glycerophosphoryl diester phosphodiesterase